ncbi:MAG: ORF6N domain-containing protein [Gammaproteobacteria bacterium]|nr:ORF6N domain-containing protein [Gammaproteobacteria bacterium]
MTARRVLVPVEQITHAILVLRGHKVLLDAELAAIYGVTTKRLNEQVRRNRGRFPADFMFQLSAQEAAVLRSQSATSKPSGRGGRRYLPNVFTEHGAIMAATVLATPRAIEMSIYVVRAFVKLRELLSSNRRLARKLEVLERSLLALDLKTQRRFKEVYDAIRALMREPAPKRRGIGFTADLDPGS